MSNRVLPDAAVRLLAARRLIEKKAHWCQFAVAKDKNGSPLDLSELPDHRGEAVQFCAIGAAIQTGADVERLDAIVDRLTKWTSIQILNDSSTHAHVLSIYDIAIAKAISNE